MSKISTQKITCPKCGREQEEEIWGSVNVTINPEAKRRIMKGDFFTFRCKNCGCEAPLVYPCLYHDMKKKLLIWILPEDGDKEKRLEQLNSTISALGIDNTRKAKRYRYRLVESVNELKEKILIFDEGLDDRTIEIMKVMYRDHSQEEGENDNFTMYLSGRKKKYEFVIFFSDGRVANTPMDFDLYKRMYNLEKFLLEEVTPLSFVAVDRKWADAALNAGKIGEKTTGSK